MTGRWHKALLIALMFFPYVASAKPPALIAIVIDDLGYNAKLAQQALALPGPVSYGILPNLPESTELADKARAKYRDVLLHIPMEPIGDHAMGPGGLTTEMDTSELKKVLTETLASVPNAIGISNHMGSRFTGDREAMRRFMTTMQSHEKLIFVDSLTTGKSKVRFAATEADIPILSRDIFLDNERDTEKIGQQLDRLVRIAKKRGYALAIAHPYPETLEFLEQRLHDFKNGPVRLVPVSLLLSSPKRER